MLRVEMHWAEVSDRRLQQSNKHMHTAGSWVRECIWCTRLMGCAQLPPYIISGDGVYQVLKMFGRDDGDIAVVVQVQLHERSEGVFLSITICRRGGTAILSRRKSIRSI